MLLSELSPHTDMGAWAAEGRNAPVELSREQIIIPHHDHHVIYPFCFCSAMWASQIPLMDPKRSFNLLSWEATCARKLDYCHYTVIHCTWPFRSRFKHIEHNSYKTMKLIGWLYWASLRSWKKWPTRSGQGLFLKAIHSCLYFWIMYPSEFQVLDFYQGRKTCKLYVYLKVLNASHKQNWATIKY